MPGLSPVNSTFTGSEASVTLVVTETITGSNAAFVEQAKVRDPRFVLRAHNTTDVCVTSPAAMPFGSAGESEAAKRTESGTIPIQRRINHSLLMECADTFL